MPAQREPVSKGRLTSPVVCVRRKVKPPLGISVILPYFPLHILQILTRCVPVQLQFQIKKKKLTLFAWQEGACNVPVIIKSQSGFHLDSEPGWQVVKTCFLCVFFRSCYCFKLWARLLYNVFNHTLGTTGSLFSIFFYQILLKSTWDQSPPLNQLY